MCLLLAGAITAVSLTRLESHRHFEHSRTTDAGVTMKSIDPLIKFSPDYYSPSDLGETDEYDVARGEKVNLQIVIWNKQAIKGFTLKCTPSSLGIKVAGIKEVGYVSISAQAAGIANKVTSSNGHFPDPLMDVNWPMNIANNGESAFWITLMVPEDIQPGTYSVMVDGSDASGAAVGSGKSIRLNVARPVASKKRYPWFSNWLFVDIPSLGPSVMKLKYLNANKPIVSFSRDYWEKIDQIASFLGENDQNTIIISAQRLAKYSFKGNDLVMDFGRFDSMVNIFVKHGVIGRIEGQHLCSRAGGWESNYVIYYVKKGPNGDAVFASGQPEDDAVRNYYKIYFGALIKHLKEKNWMNIYYQHVADEPVPSNADSYLRMVSMIREIAPELKTIDAVQSTKVADAITVPVPTLDYLSQNQAFFSDLIANGKEVWFYTAFLPQGTFANRFIEQQALQQRLLFWVAAKYNCKGVLNWGLNAWSGDDPFSGLGSKSGNYVLPAGDANLVYPKSNGLIGSIRMASMEDGIQDYALLQMLKAKNPDEAGRLIDQVVMNYDKYITDVQTFREVRKSLLQSLTQ